MLSVIDTVAAHVVSVLIAGTLRHALVSLYVVKPLHKYAMASLIGGSIPSCTERMTWYFNF
jgi:hypothetical protein